MGSEAMGLGSMGLGDAFGCVGFGSDGLMCDGRTLLTDCGDAQSAFRTAHIDPVALVVRHWTSLSENATLGQGGC